ncbi:MAG: serine/threonine-protein kinase [Polyangiaceae bacterium]
MFVDQNKQRIRSHTLVRTYGGTGVLGSRADADGLSGRSLSDPFDSAREDSEERRLLQQRLALLHKTLGLLSLGFFVLERGVAATLGSASWQQVLLGRAALFHLGATLLSGLLWLACRRMKLPVAALQAIDAAAPLLAIGAFSAMAYRPTSSAGLLVPVLCAMAALLARATLVPSSPRRTFVISCVGTLPVVAGAFMSSAAAGSVSVPAGFYVALWAGVIAGLGTLTSRTIYGLEQEVRQARQLGQYTLVERIGAGGMGVVYRAEHAMLRRPTAIKVLPPERMGEQGLSRFEREVQLTSRLTHPNTVAIYDYGRTPDGLFYYAMEYLEGLTLTSLVELAGPLPAARAAYIMRQVAGSIAEAHGIGLIHRDIKPDNILVCDRGGTCDFAKVLDFGLVKDVKSADPSLSNVNLILGTPAYMSPEAITSPSKVTFPRDLYAIGGVLFYLVTGREVFLGRTTIEVCTHQVRTPPDSPSAILGSPLPEALERLILSCLAKDPNERPASASEIEQILSTVAASDWGQVQAKEWWDSQRARITLKRSSVNMVRGSETTLVPADDLLRS